MIYKKLIPFIIFCFLVFNNGLRAQKIVSWNVKDLLTVQDVLQRRNDLKKFRKKIRPDILLIQEITDSSVVNEFVKTSGFKRFYKASTDFYPSNPTSRYAFELAIISKYPITECAEYDPHEDGHTYTGNEIGFPDLGIYGIEKQRTSRGFLMIRVEKIKVIIINVHLKSSLGKIGKFDVKNAKKREYVAAAVAKTVVALKKQFKNYTILVGGDFNVGHSDRKKNGLDLKIDCYLKDCKGKDRYDETHAIFKNGLIDQLKMVNTCQQIQTSTYPSFKGFPIDNIYYLGHKKIKKAKLAKQAYGSDHLPVWINLRQKPWK